MSTLQPIFTVTDPEGHCYSIYASGKIEGFPEGSNITLNNSAAYGRALIQHHEDLRQRERANAMRVLPQSRRT